MFLGFRSVSLEDRDGVPTLVLDPDSGLGLLRRTERSHYAEPTPVAAIPEPVRSRVVGGPLLVIARTTAVAPVHRQVRMEYVGVKKLDRAGRVRGEFRLLGLFTWKAYAEEASEVPILRKRLQQVLQAERVVPDSHEHREIVTVFDSLPKAELFAMSAEAIRAEIRTILAAERTGEVTVTLRPDAARARRRGDGRPAARRVLGGDSRPHPRRARGAFRRRRSSTTIWSSARARMPACTSSWRRREPACSPSGATSCSARSPS